MAYDAFEIDLYFKNLRGKVMKIPNKRGKVQCRSKVLGAVLVSSSYINCGVSVD